MTRATGTTSINCTACGAGIDILGGGRVVTHVCPYCGTGLDAQDDYKIIKKYANLERPKTALRIGMTGDVMGVPFTIIGTIQWRERWAGQVWTWVDHQIYSPTHGYAWLTEEDGHFVLTRKYRRLTSPAFVTTSEVERADKRPVVYADGEKYEYYDSGTSEITFVEGEFNWSPEIGHKSKVVTALGPQNMLSFEASKSEREVEMSYHMDPKETLAAFGAEAVRRPARNHPLIPYTGRASAWFYAKTAAILATLSLVLVIAIAAIPAKEVAVLPSTPVTQLPVELPFTISDTSKLTKIRVRLNVNNSWGFVELSLTDPEDVPVFDAGRTIEYYHGRDSEGSWSEGSSYSAFRFRPEMTGEYTLELDVSESGTWNRSGTAVSAISARVTEGNTGGAWLTALTVLFFILAGLNIWRLGWARSRRFSGSDWEDEDDD